MSSSSNSELGAGASFIADIKTSGAEARIAGDSKNVLPSIELKGGKKNKSRKNCTWGKMGGKKNAGGKRKSTKKSRSRK